MPSVQMNYSIIGLHIRTYRLDQHLTQEQLAERAGISYKFLGNLERGKGIPSLLTLMSLCDALGVTSNDLLRCSATHDPQAPCTLRDDHAAYAYTLTDQYFPQDGEFFLSLDDLPAVDITLPEEDESEK